MNPTVSICFIILKGTLGAPAVIDSAIPLIESAGVTVNVKSITEEESPCENIYNVFRYNNCIFRYNLKPSPGCYTHILSSHRHGSLSGFSREICSHGSRKQSISFVGSIFNLATDASVTAHELGHQFGMMHHSVPNTIDQSFSGPYTKWSRPAIKDIYTCLPSKKK